jgi:hypothetical protein
MARNPITEAILDEAKEKINQPYTTTRKIKGWLRNKVYGAQRTYLGGSTDLNSQAKEFGKQVLPTVASQAISFIPAVSLPVVSSAVSLIEKAAKDYVVGKVVERMNKARDIDLKAKQEKGTLTVAELTELVNRDETDAISPDVVGKLHDAIRKVDQAYSDTTMAIQSAKDCDTIYAAAKKYYYLSYRIVRLNTYLETIRHHVDAIQEVADRYSAQVVGYQFDLADAMDAYYDKTDEAHHKQNCKNRSTCYYQSDGMS